MRNLSVGQIIIRGTTTRVISGKGLVVGHALIIFWYSVLTWISIFWFSRAGPAASIRIYFEVAKSAPGEVLSDLFTVDQTSAVPMGYSFFPKELARLPRR